MCNKLVIIGNGFDLAHGLKTSYDSFANKNMNHPVMKEFKQLMNTINCESPIFNKYGKHINFSWFSFERSIERLSDYTYGFMFDGGKEKQLEYGNRLFEVIESLLFNYIQEVNNCMDIPIIESISEVIDKSTYAISFNYTDTIKLYTKQYEYIHGSISDDRRIILGFADSRTPCLAYGEYIKHTKYRQKLRLDYYRFIKDLNLEHLFDDLIKEFDEQLLMYYSGKKGFDYPIIKTPDGNEKYDLSQASYPLQLYLTQSNFLEERYKSGPKFNKIKELLVIGHGLESDLDYLEELSNEMPRLQRVVLFTYEQESAEDINRKKATLNDLFNIENIEILRY